MSRTALDAPQAYRTGFSPHDNRDSSRSEGRSGTLLDDYFVKIHRKTRIDMKNLLLAQFDFHHRLYNNVLEGFTDAESNARLNGDTNVNHVKYIAGHLLNSQYALGFLSGFQVEPKWVDLFAPVGQSWARDDIEYPGIEAIKSQWNGMHQNIHDGFSALSSEALNSTAPEPLGSFFAGNLDFGNTIAGVWAFLNHHQAYHIGQIGILRRGFGKPPMRYD